MARGRAPKPKYAKLWKAPEVEKLARTIIGAHHPHLRTQPITFAFAPETLKVRGVKAWGKAEVVGGKTAAFKHGLPDSQVPVETDDRFFLMTISNPAWKNLTDAQKEALVDHELCHMGVSDKGAPAIWPHDVEEFRAIIDRHGLWRQDVRKFAESCASAGQLGLPLAGAEGGENAPPAKPNGGHKHATATVEFEGEKAGLGTPEGEVVARKFLEASAADLESQRAAARPN